MLTFNCYACQARDKVGGPTELTDKLFTTTTPEMGDEGRVPPALDGVGAKLTSDYLKQLLDKHREHFSEQPEAAESLISIGLSKRNESIDVAELAEPATGVGQQHRRAAFE